MRISQQTIVQLGHTLSDIMPLWDESMDQAAVAWCRGKEKEMSSQKFTKFNMRHGNACALTGRGAVLQDGLTPEEIFRAGASMVIDMRRMEREYHDSTEEYHRVAHARVSTLALYRSSGFCAMHRRLHVPVLRGEEDKNFSERAIFVHVF